MFLETEFCPYIENYVDPQISLVQCLATIAGEFTAGAQLDSATLLWSKITFQ